ncbi:TPA: hypothetical protein ACGVBR_003999, partial [Vibrio vulnificus]
KQLWKIFPMDKIKKIAIYIFLIQFSFSSLGAEPSLISFQEQYNSKVKVSGVFYAGVVVGDRKVDDSLYVTLPEKENNNLTLCLEVKSVDGVYFANLEYDISKSEQGLNKLEFPTEYIDELSNISTNGLAINGWLSEDCNSSKIGVKHIMSSWGDFGEHGTLTLLIRSDARKDVAYIPSENAFIYRAKCLPIEEVYAISFDKLCKFSNVDFSKVKAITVKRRNLGSIPDEVILID